MEHRKFTFGIGANHVAGARRLLVAAAAAAASACTTAPPVGTPLQSNASVAAPVVVAGDSWTYRVRDGFTGLARGTQTHRVTAADSGRISVSVTHESGALEEVHVYDREWGWVRRPATNLHLFDYEPAYHAFEFPLLPGKTWRERLTATDPRDGRRFPVWLDAAAQGWERIKVPAGEFDAIRVRRFVVVNYWEYTERGHSETVELEWYAPAVKQVVRRETSGKYLSLRAGTEAPFLRTRGRGDGGGPRMELDDWLIWELTRYEVR